MLEIAVGLGFVYLLLSLVVTAVTEMFSRLRALRSNNLYVGILNLIGEFHQEEEADPKEEEADPKEEDAVPKKKCRRRSRNRQRLRMIFLIRRSSSPSPSH